MTYTYDYPHPAVTVDIVVFSIIGAELMVALIERAGEPFEGRWALPGGFIRENEDLMDGALRELSEEIGVTGLQLYELPFLQVKTYGTPGRDPRGHVVSVAFMTLVPSDRVNLVASTDARKAEWFAMRELPPLAFDHDHIITDARAKLSALVSNKLSEHADTVFAFLPKEFTLSEAQGVFEIVKGEALDRGNFRKWIAANWNLIDVGKKAPGGRHRPAALFSLDQAPSISTICTQLSERE